MESSFQCEHELTVVLTVVLTNTIDTLNAPTYYNLQLVDKFTGAFTRYLLPPLKAKHRFTWIMTFLSSPGDVWRRLPSGKLNGITTFQDQTIYGKKIITAFNLNGETLFECITLNNRIISRTTYNNRTYKIVKYGCAIYGYTVTLVNAYYKIQYFPPNNKFIIKCVSNTVVITESERGIGYDIVVEIKNPNNPGEDNNIVKFYASSKQSFIYQITSKDIAQLNDLKHTNSEDTIYQIVAYFTEKYNLRLQGTQIWTQNDVASEESISDDS